MDPEVRRYIDEKIGTPYEVNGRGPNSFDCFGLTVDYFREVRGKNIEASFEEVPDGWHRDKKYRDYKKRLLATHGEWVKEPQEDCIVLISSTGDREIDHIGVYLGEDKILNTGKHGVFVTRLSALLRMKRVRGYIRVKD